MKPYEHQDRIAKQALKILKENLIVYLAMEERTGKTLTSILVYEQTKCKNILVITKKKAISGWEDTIKAYKPKNNYHIINYESLHKCTFKPDAIIIDEAHSKVAAYPKTSTTWKAVFNFTKGKPIIFLSATPSAQTYCQLYHQLKLSSWTPWLQYTNFYTWHKAYGIPEVIFLAGRQVKQYHNCKTDDVWNDVKHLFISYKRQELGFKHEPVDKIHKIQLNTHTKSLYNDLLRDKVLELKDSTIIADTPMSLRLKLHQIEGGTIKFEDSILFLGNTEKIDFIKNTWGDTKNLVIFYQYKAELILLNKHFKNASILQGTSFAEGVDLSMYDTCVVYSMDFSTAKYTQRRARQCNMKRETNIDFHFVIVEGAISEQVYNTVAVNKENFVDKYFDKKEI